MYHKQLTCSNNNYPAYYFRSIMKEDRWTS